MDFIDQPKTIREGEELDPDKIKTFLRDSMPGLSGELVIRQFPSGFSNLTYLLTVGEKDMILRRPPFGTKAKTAHDMDREFRILQALKPVFPYCPKALVYCDDPSVMDSPFYVMERIKGIILRNNLPPGMKLSPPDARRLCENLVEVWRRLHAIDYEKIGLAGFGKPKGYVKRQVEGWSRRYRNAKTDDAPDFERVMLWLAEHMPPDTEAPAIIHNDYKFDNIVLDPSNSLRIIGILDWEMATIGDPLMDLGASLAYWVERNDPENVQMMRRLPTNLEGMLTREELVDLYAKKTGRRVDGIDFYYCFGLFRLAVIAQQIYYRFYHGQTRDERFRMLVFAVHILEQAAGKVVEQAT